MKIKTKLIQNEDGTFKVKASYSNGRRKLIKYFTADQLEVSDPELPAIDFRSKILERLKNEEKRI